MSILHKYCPMVGTYLKGSQELHPLCDLITFSGYQGQRECPTLTHISNRTIGQCR